MKEAKQHPTRLDVWVTPDGRIFQELHVTRDGAGYGLVNLSGRSGGKVRRHVLVCETYHGPRPLGQVVRHRNGIPGDDREDNLEWGTQAENLQDAARHGTTTQGQKNIHAKLTDDQVLEIRRRIKSGEKQKDIASWFGVSQPTISEIKSGTAWKHVKEKI